MPSPEPTLASPRNDPATRAAIVSHESRSERVSEWMDGQISSGKEWNNEIEDASSLLCESGIPIPDGSSSRHSFPDTTSKSQIKESNCCFRRPHALTVSIATKFPLILLTGKKLSHGVKCQTGASSGRGLGKKGRERGSSKC